MHTPSIHSHKPIHTHITEFATDVISRITQSPILQLYPAWLLGFALVHLACALVLSPALALSSLVLLVSAVLTVRLPQTPDHTAAADDHGDHLVGDLATQLALEQAATEEQLALARGEIRKLEDNNKTLVSRVVALQQANGCMWVWICFVSRGMDMFCVEGKKCVS